MTDHPIERPDNFVETPQNVRGPRCTKIIAGHEPGTTRQCPHTAVGHTGVCKMHGGKGAIATVGPAAHNYKHGRYSKYRIPQLEERFREAATDPALLEQREEIVIFNKLVQDCVDRLDSGDPGELWLDLRETLRKFQVERRAASVPGAPKAHTLAAGSALSKIESLIERGADQVVLRRELRQTMLDQDKIVRSERKRLAEMQQLVTTEQATALFQAIMHEINLCVSNVDDRMRLNQRLISLARGTL